MSIARLPPEMLTTICGYLDLHEWCSLRITCQQIYSLPLEAFARRYHRSLSLLVTTENLSQLQQIAARDLLRTSFREIWIVPTLFEGWPKIKYLEFASSEYGRRSTKYDRKEKSWNITQAELEARFAAYQAVIAGHRSILESSTLSDILAKCLALCENTVTTGLRSYPINLLLNSEKEAGVSCLGSPELRKQLSCGERHTVWFYGPIPASLAISHAMAFSALVKALIRSGQRVQSLHTCGNYVCGLSLQQIQLAESDYPSLLSLLEGIRSLRICIQFPKEISVGTRLERKD
ncbi:hypothetical protein PEBR_17645 [Penicillium brasilianum]|uniref:F-box domain-containing protein n=1 Tax=Penicillium brasilianum TaxID=104259 RepID=A0A1S9RPL7_PENBI|nr:hypothetical protein PEBR_17645 [Penicillium brasilianum]